MLTQETLKELLDYNPETGCFFWKQCRSDWAGRAAGGIDGRGYLKIVIERKTYTAGRLAWFYMTGEWPKHFIDHINLNRSDNRFSNIREATRAQNHTNFPLKRNNTSGHKGVYWHKREKKWKVQIAKDGKRHHRTFKTKEEACTFYRKKAQELHGEFARLD